MHPLRYRSYWIVASSALVAFVVWGSLQVGLRNSGISGFDKVEHFATYLVLATWFTGLFRRSRWWLVAATLLALGLAMEFAQYAMQAGRTADVHDLMANAAGIVAGLLLATALTGDWAQRVEAWLR